jgi:hypothetical protein
MEYIYMYTIYTDIGLVTGNINIPENADKIIKNKQTVAQRDIILLKKMQHSGVPPFPMTKNVFEKYKGIIVGLTLNNPVLYLMFVTKVKQVDTSVMMVNIGHSKSFESQRAAYNEIYNLEEDTFRKLYEHRVPVYSVNKSIEYN